MKPFLLDANVLIALLWPAHQHHPAAQKWFRSHSREPWATCVFTQAAFIRITSNPMFSRDAVTPAEASERLSANLLHPRHRFLAESVPFSDAVAPLLPWLHTHQQVTDAYLVGLALHHGGKLVTFDQGIRALAPPEAPHSRAVEILPSA